jgi:hypothetical protein
MALADLNRILPHAAAGGLWLPVNLAPAENSMSHAMAFHHFCQGNGFRTAGTKNPKPPKPPSQNAGSTRLWQAVFNCL